jgi:hypothetical protein
MSDDDITRLRTLAQADAAARHRAMQWHADQRLTDQDDDEVHHTTEALRARLDGFVILELLDRQRAAPSAEPVITDAMVEAACKAFSEAVYGDEPPRIYKVRSLAILAALAAALEEK